MLLLDAVAELGAPRPLSVDEEPVLALVMTEAGSTGVGTLRRWASVGEGDLLGDVGSCGFGVPAPLPLKTGEAAVEDRLPEEQGATREKQGESTA